MGADVAEPPKGRRVAGSGQSAGHSGVPPLPWGERRGPSGEDGPGSTTSAFIPFLILLFLFKCILVQSLSDGDRIRRSLDVGVFPKGTF